jgi:nickel-dependent lactate racemase
LTGVIEPHSLSGFNGGRQSICPGIAATETVAPCYSPALLEHENVRPGCIEENPVHAEQMEIARKAGCDFIVNAVLNQDKKIAKVFGGHLNYAFLEGVAHARKRQTDTIEKQVDIVITSGGGSPYDRTWLQTIRGIVGAFDILKPGGTIIIASACEEGLGGTEFGEIGDQFSSIDDFMSAITADQSFTEQWKLQELAKVLRKGKVKAVSSGIPAETLQKLFVVPCATVEEAVAEALQEYGAEASIAVIPSGPCVLALAKQKEPALKKPEVKKAEPKKIAPEKTEPEKTQPEKVEPVKEEVKKTVKKATTKKATSKTATKKAEPKKATAKKATKK